MPLLRCLARLHKVCSGSVFHSTRTRRVTMKHLSIVTVAKAETTDGLDPVAILAAVFKFILALVAAKF